jgi:hypothetical protein
MEDNGKQKTHIDIFKRKPGWSIIVMDNRRQFSGCKMERG